MTNEQRLQTIHDLASARLRNLDAVRSEVDFEHLETWNSARRVRATDYGTEERNAMYTRRRATSCGPGVWSMKPRAHLRAKSF